MHTATPQHIPLALTRRGGHIENVFYGSFAVVDAKGEVIAQGGDVNTPLFTRSALKPFQALAFMAHPQRGQFGLTPADIALLCASHNGEHRHAERAKSLLAKIGATSDALQCGSHLPYWYTATNAAVPSGQTWSPLQHNCSGKHSGMLLYAALLGAASGNYLAPDSAIQIEIRKAVAYAAGVADAATMPMGTDGCSAPNYALPLRSLARAFAWLAQTESDPRFGNAGVELYDAMAKHPEMVSGEGRNDLDLARAGDGEWVNKVGADGVQTLASRKHGKAIAMKISDGNQTALMVAFCSVLRQLGMLDAGSNAALRRWIDVPISNIRGTVIGGWESLVSL